MNSRELVVKTLKFDYPERIPRDLWYSSFIESSNKDGLNLVQKKFPKDIDWPLFTPGLSSIQKKSSFLPRSMFEIEAQVTGKYIEEWGSIIYCAEDGVAGEVKEPILNDWSKLNNISVPWDFLESTDLSHVNSSCENSDKFMLSGICARPFETLQFIRGVENVLIDIIINIKDIKKLLKIIHEFNLEHIKLWLKTKVDGIWLMDDWGAQDRLLIPPNLWRELLKPLYIAYCKMIHESGKFVFFHSDGFIEEIFDDVIEIGIDAISTQLFCMNIEELGRKYKKKITFWGEMDRQKLLPFGKPFQIQKAVSMIKKCLYEKSGGFIALCEWGKNVPQENIEAYYNSWNDLS